MSVSLGRRCGRDIDRLVPIPPTLNVFSDSIMSLLGPLVVVFLLLRRRMRQNATSPTIANPANTPTTAPTIAPVETPPLLADSPLFAAAREPDAEGTAVLDTVELRSADRAANAARQDVSAPSRTVNAMEVESFN